MLLIRFWGLDFIFMLFCLFISFLRTFRRVIKGDFEMDYQSSSPSFKNVNGIRVAVGHVEDRDIRV